MELDGGVSEGQCIVIVEIPSNVSGQHSFARFERTNSAAHAQILTTMCWC